MRGFVEAQGVSLQGEQQPENYIEDSLYILLYHDISTRGYNKVVKMISRWYPNKHNALRINCQRLRLALSEWATTKFRLGTLDEWIQAAANTRPNSHPQNVNIWVDSTDFQLQRGKEMGKKSHHWSFKLNAPGRRYMVFRNGLGRVVYFNGGYSPKIRDYDWVESHADWINATFRGATIIGDNDWRTAMRSIDTAHITIHAPYSAPRGRGAQDRPQLTAQQELYNQRVRNKRARIENFFGGLETKFPILKVAWAEDVLQLDALVRYAAAIMSELKA
jgi:hypothetical protein